MKITKDKGDQLERRIRGAVEKIAKHRLDPITRDVEGDLDKRAYLSDLSAYCVFKSSERQEQVANRMLWLTYWIIIMTMTVIGLSIIQILGILYN